MRHRPNAIMMVGPGAGSEGERFFLAFADEVRSVVVGLVQQIVVVIVCPENVRRLFISDASRTFGRQRLTVAS